MFIKYSAVIILLTIGLLSIFLEFFLPGGIMGLLGGLLLIASIVVFANQAESIIATLIYAIFVIGIMVVTFRFALWRLTNASQESGLVSREDQKGFFASSYDHDTIGKVGVAESDLRPGGRVLIEGKRHQAISQSGYIVKGSHVTVIAGEGESLIVKLKK